MGDDRPDADRGGACRAAGRHRRRRDKRESRSAAQRCGHSRLTTTRLPVPQVRAALCPLGWSCRRRGRRVEDDPPRAAAARCVCWWLHSQGSAHPAPTGRSSRPSAATAAAMRPSSQRRGGPLSCWPPPVGSRAACSRCCTPQAELPPGWHCSSAARPRARARSTSAPSSEAQRSCPSSSRTWTATLGPLPFAPAQLRVPKADPNGRQRDCATVGRIYCARRTQRATPYCTRRHDAVTRR